ncbi:MAG: hypothetical protein ABH883_01595, partial [Candidatus Omnitrophota bacterium]
MREYFNCRSIREKKVYRKAVKTLSLSIALFLFTESFIFAGNEFPSDVLAVKSPFHNILSKIGGPEYWFRFDTEMNFIIDTALREMKQGGAKELSRLDINASLNKQYSGTKGMGKLFEITDNPRIGWDGSIEIKLKTIRPGGTENFALTFTGDKAEDMHDASKTLVKEAEGKTVPVLIWQGHIDPVWGENFGLDTLDELFLLAREERESLEKAGIEHAPGKFRKRIETIVMKSLINAAERSGSFNRLDFCAIRDVFIETEEYDARMLIRDLSGSREKLSDLERLSLFFMEKNAEALYSAARNAYEYGIDPEEYFFMAGFFTPGHDDGYEAGYPGASWSPRDLYHENQRIRDIVLNMGNFWRYYENLNPRVSIKACYCFLRLTEEEPYCADMILTWLRRLRSAGDLRATAILPEISDPVAYEADRPLAAKLFDPRSFMSRVLVNINSPGQLHGMGDAASRPFSDSRPRLYKGPPDPARTAFFNDLEEGKIEPVFGKNINVDMVPDLYQYFVDGKAVPDAEQEARVEAPAAGGLPLAEIFTRSMVNYARVSGKFPYLNADFIEKGF